MAKFEIEDGTFNKAMEWIEELDGDMKSVTEKALKETHAHITPKLHQEMKKHHLTGATEKSIVETARVKWVGWVASVEVGFDINNGGLPSIFLMYGTPRMKKDTKLYNAIYGKKTKDEITEIQVNVFENELDRLASLR